MTDDEVFRFQETMEVVDRQAESNVCASHMLSLLAITLGTAAKQVVWGFFMPLLSAHARLPLCAAFKKKGPSSGSISQERLETL